MRLLWAMLGFGLAAFALGACGPTGEKEGTAPQGGSAVAATGTVVFNRGNGTEPDTLDPHRSSGAWENNIISDMFEGLMTMNERAEPIYGSAVSHTVTPDGLVYTFTMRPGMVWSDGEPVTARDFEFAFRRILDPATTAQYASLLYPIKSARAVNEGRLPKEQLGVRAIDDATFEISLENPTPFLLQLLTHQTAQAVPKHLIERVGDDWVKAGTMVTNGPYVLAEWTPNTHVKLVKNERFYEADQVQIDTIYFYPINDSAIEVKRFQAGELDFTSSFPARQLEDLKAKLGDQVIVHPYIASSYLQINVLKAPFTDVRVREALSLAMNREALTDQVLKAGQVPAYSFVPPGMANYAETAELAFKAMSMEERKERARTLLAEAGFGPNNPLTFTYRYMDGLDSRRAAIAAADMWKEVGAEATLLNTEVRVHYNALRTQDFEVADAGWVADYNDAENYLFLLQSTSGQMNYSKYKNETFDALMAKASLTLDLAERAAILKQAEQVMLDDHPVIPQFVATHRHLLAPHLEGYVPNMLNWNRTRYLRIERTSS